MIRKRSIVNSRGNGGNTRSDYMSPAAHRARASANGCVTAACHRPRLAPLRARGKRRAVPGTIRLWSGRPSSLRSDPGKQPAPLPSLRKPRNRRSAMSSSNSWRSTWRARKARPRSAIGWAAWGRSWAIRKTAMSPGRTSSRRWSGSRKGTGRSAKQLAGEILTQAKRLWQFAETREWVAASCIEILTRRDIDARPVKRDVALRLDELVQVWKVLGDTARNQSPD